MADASVRQRAVGSGPSSPNSYRYRIGPAAAAPELLHRYSAAVGLRPVQGMKPLRLTNCQDILDHWYSPDIWLRLTALVLSVYYIVNTFGAIDSVVVSAGAGAIALGFPVVVDIDLGENQVPGALESVCDHAETVKKSLELRNIKIKVKELPIPVAFAAAFEGEIIRKAV